MWFIGFVGWDDNKMTFVNEKSTLNRLIESKKYEELYYRKTGIRRSFVLNDWTIDRERTIVLICIYNERQDMYEGDYNISTWLFYWRGEWVRFTQQNSLGGKISETHWKTTRKIINIEMPETIKAAQMDMYKDLKEAFQVYRISGAFSTTDYRFDLFLDYSQVM